MTLSDSSDTIYRIRQIWQCNNEKPDVFCMIRFVESDFLKVQKQSPEVFCKKKVFLGISQNSWEKTCAWDSFSIKLQVLGLRTPPDDCF